MEIQVPKKRFVSSWKYSIVSRQVSVCRNTYLPSPFKRSHSKHTPSYPEQNVLLSQKDEQQPSIRTHIQITTAAIPDRQPFVLPLCTQIAVERNGFLSASEDQGTLCITWKSRMRRPILARDRGNTSLRYAP